jgi:oxygen-independent coproporphyrinogen-3 oxidase
MAGRINRNLSLAGQIDGDVSRSALQHFYVRPSLPEKRLGWDDLIGAWRRWVVDAAAGKVSDRLHFYMHVPFCSHRCQYCIYYSVAPPDPVRVAAWVTRMRLELPFWGEILDGMPLWSLYVGGGTPTVLEPAALQDVLGLIRSNFQIRPGGERSFECNPLTVSREKALVFADAGFNRASFGVQTISPAMLTGVNRGYQTLQNIDDTFRILNEFRFRINVDLLQGLPGESAMAVKDSLAYVMGHGPAEITMYTLSPSTPAAVFSRAVPRSLGDVASELAGIADDAGYSVSVFETSLKFQRKLGRGLPDLVAAEADATGEITYYDDVFEKPASLLAIGPTTRSQVFANLRYTFDLHQPDKPFNPVGECATGRILTRREAQGQFVIRGLARNLGVNSDAFRQVFGESIEQAFNTELSEAVDAGLIQYRDGSFYHTDGGPAERFATEMLFVEDDKIADLEKQLKHQSVGSEGAESVQVIAGPVRFKVVLDEVAGISRPAHTSGAFAFYVPTANDGCEDVAERAVVRLFVRLFDAVVTRDCPTTVSELRDFLVLRGRALALSAPESSILHGAVMRVEAVQ